MEQIKVTMKMATIQNTRKYTLKRRFVCVCVLLMMKRDKAASLTNISFPW